MQRRNHHRPSASREKREAVRCWLKKATGAYSHLVDVDVCVHTEYSPSPRRRQPTPARNRLPPLLRFSPLPKNRSFPDSEFPVFLRFLLRSKNIIVGGENRGGEAGGGKILEAFAKSGLSWLRLIAPGSIVPSKMNSESGELLGIDPVELRFPFELKKQISCGLQLTNKTDEQVAFKVKTTSPKKYCVRPNNGIVPPRSTADVLVTMQAQREAPPDMQCKDKFLVQSAIVGKDITPKDITGDLFTKESGNVVDEVKLKVVYVTPSSQTEGSEDGSPGSLSYQETTKEPKESEKMTAEPFALISKLMEEKNSAMEQNKKLREELDLLRRGISSQHGGFSLVFVLLVAILGILLGFIMKR